MTHENAVQQLTYKILKLHESVMYRVLESAKLRKRIKNLKIGLRQCKAHYEKELARYRTSNTELNQKLLINLKTK